MKRWRGIIETSKLSNLSLQEDKINRENRGVRHLNSRFFSVLLYRKQPAGEFLWLNVRRKHQMFRFNFSFMDECANWRLQIAVVIRYRLNLNFLFRFLWFSISHSLTSFPKHQPSSVIVISFHISIFPHFPQKYIIHFFRTLEAMSICWWLIDIYADRNTIVIIIFIGEVMFLLLQSNIPASFMSICC